MFVIAPKRLASRLTPADLADLVEQLGRLEPAADDGERIDQITQLERLKSAAAAAQATVTAAFATSQRATLTAAGVARDRQATPIGAQVALARRDSPVRGSRHLGLAEALVHEMPHTRAALARGEISEWRATLLVRETACVSREHRGRVDAELADRLGTLGDLRTAREARKITYRLDPHSVMARVRGAETDRRVSIRPAPDTMSLVTGFLPARDGVAVHLALSSHADTLRASGDSRSRGQLMADEFVARLTGRATDGSRTERTAGSRRLGLEIQLMMTDQALLRHRTDGPTEDDEVAATLVGYGPVPAAYARSLVRDLDPTSTAWLRRLFVDPRSGVVVAADTRRRLFNHTQRRVLIARDELCRTPWCDAPVRHGDHVVAHEDGGPTSLANGQGLCERCNHVKQGVGWRAGPQPGGLIETTTPTGHTYRSPPPRAVTTLRADLVGSPLEKGLAVLLDGFGRY